MSLFQLVIASAFYGLSRLVPIPTEPFLHGAFAALGWDELPEKWLAVCAVGVLLAVSIKLLHDLLSVVSSSLQLLFLQRKPQTLDDRIILYVLIVYLPVFGLQRLLPILADWDVLPDALLKLLHAWQSVSLTHASLTSSVALLLSSALLTWRENWNRQDRRPFDWGWLQITQLSAVTLLSALPGADWTYSLWLGAAVLQFSREGSRKILLYCSIPFLVEKATSIGVDLPSLLEPLPGGAEWSGKLALGTVLVVSTITALIAVGSLLRPMSTSPVQRWGWIRLGFSVVLVGAVLFLG